MIIDKCEYSNGFCLEFDEYISYDPKDNKRISYRECLYDSLQKLENNENKILQATYSAKKLKFKNNRAIDLDNVLFYNLWSHRNNLFNCLCQKGLRFEFRHKDISKHRYSYKLVDKEESFPKYWYYDCDNLLIEWNDIYCQSSIQDIIYCIKTKNKSGAHFFLVCLKEQSEIYNSSSLS